MSPMKPKTLTYLSTLLIYIHILLPYAPQATAAPSISHHSKSIDTNQDFERALDQFLNAYYKDFISKNTNTATSQRPDEPEDITSSKRRKNVNEVLPVDIYNQMQGDQPVIEDTSTSEMSTEEFMKAKERLRKENWVEYLKSQILTQLGRTNATTFTKPPEDPSLSDLNITQIIPAIFNNTNLDDDQITEKIRSFYPSCDPPQNQDLEQWKDSEDIMNLYFDFDYNSDNRNSNIATATLRLYRLPQNSTNKFDSAKDDCKTIESVEDDRLLRVSVYWYTKLQKKRRVKRRLSDSKVVSETSRWVELSVKPATKAWNRPGMKNLGLGILVEDQEGKALRADKYFKGASCTVGVSTPIPIPTIVRDASHVQADELDRIHSLFGRNSTSTVYSDVLLLPTVDICYLEFPDNTDISQYNSARINACNLRKIHEENQRMAERERIERLATLQFPNVRHIRHQRQHRQSKLNAGDLAQLKLENLTKVGAHNDRQMSEFERDIRNSISNKQIIFTREEVEEIQRDRG